MLNSEWTRNWITGLHIEFQPQISHQCVWLTIFLYFWAVMFLPIKNRVRYDIWGGAYQKMYRKGKLNHLVACQASKADEWPRVNFFPLTLIPIGRPCDLLMFPDYKVSLEKGNLFLQFLPLIQGALMTLLLYIFISLGSFTSTFVTCAASGWQFVRIQQPVFKLLLVRSARSSLWTLTEDLGDIWTSIYQWQKLTR